jgi:hypothetical protein
MAFFLQRCFLHVVIVLALVGCLVAWLLGGGCVIAVANCGLTVFLIALAFVFSDGVMIPSTAH